MENMSNLKALLQDIHATLNTHSTVILQAPTGSGKTTRVPLYLLDHLPTEQKILMLEPRRLAARSVARYMASLRGEKVGESVGYRVRLDTQVSKNTRLEIVTEGILLRLLQQDPELSEYALVIFDEFHERSLQADLGLALARQCQSLLREDLQLLIMSATLDTENLSALLDAPVLSAEGRQFPVDIQYRPPANTRRQQTPGFVPIAHIVQQIQHTLSEETGSVLVFLPGSGEIRRVQNALRNLPNNTFVAPLYGGLSPAAQDQAIAPAPAGQRKVVLATNIAETSLTIEGIRVVIDSGMERRPFFDSHSGMTRLVTGQIARSSADQRAGRAGRMEPGVCLRLWSSGDHARMSPQQEPEILHSDLAPLALELAHWGTPDPTELEWLDPPPEKAYAQAQELLIQLQALTPQFTLTPHGKKMARFPVTPRLAHMLIQANSLKEGSLACYTAALLSERDLISGTSDMQRRFEALNKGLGHAKYILQSAKQLAGHLKLKLQEIPRPSQREALGLLLGLAYPDRIAQHRSGDAPRFLLSGGRGAVLPESDPLAHQDYLAVADLDGNPREAKIYLAAALSKDQLEELTAHATVPGMSIDTRNDKVRVFETLNYGALTLERKRIKNPDPQQLQSALCQVLRQQGIHKLPWEPPQTQWLARVNFLRQHEPERWPEITHNTLRADLEHWLGPFLTGLNSPQQVTAEHLQQALDYLLGYDKVADLDRLAPTHLPVPSGSRVRLDYTQGDIPVLPVRLQEVFGMEETPGIYSGKVMVMMHLLSPARRPVQVTQDLKSFWNDTYHDVKKELKGRYPRHYWPDNPLEAEATGRVKPRKR